MLPKNLLLVRHGQSDGNKANKASKNGDDSLFTDEFMRLHSSRYRLTPRGVQQAQLTGRFLREEFPSFDRYYVSQYIRAMETAAHLELSGAEWQQELYLRERDMGLIDAMPESQKMLLYEKELQLYKSDPFWWRPPNGESMAEVSARVGRVLGTLHRKCADQNVVIVCHGMVMWAFRIRLEHWTPDEFLRRSQENIPGDKIYNGQVFHYSRVNPDTGQLSDKLSYFRSIGFETGAPHDYGWQGVRPKKYSNEDLLQIVSRYPHMT